MMIGEVYRIPPGDFLEGYLFKIISFIKKDSVIVDQITYYRVSGEIRILRERCWHREVFKEHVLRTNKKVWYKLVRDYARRNQDK